MWIGTYSHPTLLAVTDALHGYADGAADFWGVRVEYRGGTRRERLLGNRVIGGLLCTGAVVMLLTVLVGGVHATAFGMVLAGGLAGTLNLVRVWVLVCGYERSADDTSGGLLIHAISDFIHSILLLAVGLSLLTVQLFEVDNAVDVVYFFDRCISGAYALYLINVGIGIAKGKHHGHFLVSLAFKILRKSPPEHHH